MKTTFARMILFCGAGIGTLLLAQTASQPTQVQQPQVQPAPPPPPLPPTAHRPANPQQQLNHLTKKLALTADQQNQLLPILTNRDQQVSGIESDTTLTPKERHSRMVAVRNDADSRLRNVLTDTQRAAYDQMLQEARDHAKARKQGSVSN